MWRIPFLIYCVAAWEVFLFEPWLAINPLIFGAVIVGRRLERAAAPAQGRATVDVPFTSQRTNRARAKIEKCPLCANSGLIRLFDHLVGPGEQRRRHGIDQVLSQS